MANPTEEDLRAALATVVEITSALADSQLSPDTRAVTLRNIIASAIAAEREKAAKDVINAALAELREMFPEPHLGRVFVTQKFCYSTEDNGAFEVWNIEGRIFGDSPFVGRTLEEAMQEIRQWKEESK